MLLSMSLVRMAPKLEWWLGMRIHKYVPCADGWHVNIERSEVHGNTGMLDGVVLCVYYTPSVCIVCILSSLWCRDKFPSGWAQTPKSCWNSHVPLILLLPRYPLLSPSDQFHWLSCWMYQLWSKIVYQNERSTALFKISSRYDLLFEMAYFLFETSNFLFKSRLLFEMETFYSRLVRDQRLFIRDWNFHSRWKFSFEIALSSRLGKYNTWTLVWTEFCFDRRAGRKRSFPTIHYCICPLPKSSHRNWGHEHCIVCESNQKAVPLPLMLGSYPSSLAFVAHPL